MRPGERHRLARDPHRVAEQRGFSAAKRLAHGREDVDGARRRRNDPFDRGVPARDARHQLLMDVERTRLVHVALACRALHGIEQFFRTAWTDDDAGGTESQGVEMFVRSGSRGEDDPDRGGAVAKAAGEPQPVAVATADIDDGDVGRRPSREAER